MAEISVIPREEKPFYTIGSLARRLTMSERTVKRKIKSGEIPSYDFDGIRRIDPADVDSYLAKHRDEGRKAA